MTYAEPKAPPTTADIVAEIEDLRRQLKAANHAAAADRMRLAEIDREPQGPADPDPLDVELEDLRRQVAEAEEETRAAAARRDELEAQARESRLERALERAAERHFPGDPELAVKLVDRTGVDVDPESGRVVGATEAIQQLARDYPGLARSKPRNFIGGSPAAMKVRGPASQPPPVIPRLPDIGGVEFM